MTDHKIQNLPEAVFNRIADSIAATDDPTERLNLALQISRDPEWIASFKQSQTDNAAYYATARQRLKALQSVITEPKGYQSVRHEAAHPQKHEPLQISVPAHKKRFKGHVYSAEEVAEMRAAHDYIETWQKTDFREWSAAELEVWRKRDDLNRMVRESMIPEHLEYFKAHGINPATIRGTNLIKRFQKEDGA